jgi:hypothetical protein
MVLQSYLRRRLAPPGGTDIWRPLLRRELKRFEGRVILNGARK